MYQPTASILEEVEKYWDICEYRIHFIVIFSKSILSSF